jgi:phosphoribosyl 1,2-cyclic phosphate phosphodiesterase
MPFLEGLDTLVINALHRKPHFSHLNLSEALELIDRIVPRQTFLTHLSHDMGRHADVLSELPAHVSLAYDGLSISVHMNEGE